MEKRYKDTGISIHAPREGGDDHEVFYQYQKSAFQSTPPARGATYVSLARELMRIKISIHAPREGGDVGSQKK